jgi:tRNA threonylcarbamoyladenosine biosynthesis protein TsaE
VVFLSGELGAGKTTLARGFLHACGVSGAVRSPTYTLVELYALQGLTIVHADLYRLQDPAELDTLGLRDWARPGYLWLLEWPERGAGHLPAPDLTIQLTIGPQAHALDLAAHSDLGKVWLQHLQRG